MGKAVNIMKSGGAASNVPYVETPAVSTGNGGIPASLKIKAAGQKEGSPVNTGLSPDGQRKLAPGEKINNLF